MASPLYSGYSGQYIYHKDRLVNTKRYSGKIGPTVSKHVLERPGPQQEDQVEASEDARVACGTVRV